MTHSDPPEAGSVRSVPETAHDPAPAHVEAGVRKAEPESLARVARLVFAAGLFLVPLVFNPRTLDVFNLVKITVLWLTAVAACGLWLYATHAGGTRRSPGRSPIIRASLLLLGVTLVATLLSDQRTLSFIGFYRRYEGFASLVLYVGVLIFIAALYKGRPDALREVAIAVAAASGLVGVYVVFQKAGVDLVQWHLPAAGAPPFPIGSLGNSAFTASYFGIAAPFVLYLVLTASSLARRAAWLAVGMLSLLGLWFTQGRAGMGAAAIGILTFGLYSFRIRTAVRIGAITAALFVLALAPIIAGDVSDTSTEGVLRAGTAGYRVELWEASVHMVRDRPVFGRGPETFFESYPGYRTPQEAARDGLVIPDSPHNIYLSWATSAGVAGLLAFLGVVGLALVTAARRTEHLPPQHRRLTATFAAALAAYLGQGVYSLDVPPLALMCWVALGGLAVLTARSQAPARDRATGTRSAPRRIGTPVVIALGVVVLIVLGTRPLRADATAWSAQRLAPEGWSDETMALYDKAIALHPREAAYHAMSASYLERVARGAGAPFSTASALREALDRYDEALELQSRNLYHTISLARVNARLGTIDDVRHFSAADRWMRRAEALDPFDPAVYEMHANILKQWASKEDGRKRREILRRANELAARPFSLG